MMLKDNKKIVILSDQRLGGKFVALDLFYKPYNIGIILRNESGSRCPQRVNLY